MPYSLALMSTEMAATANWTWAMYPGLSKGAINTILSHCTDELKEKCVSLTLLLLSCAYSLTLLPRHLRFDWPGTSLLWCLVNGRAPCA